MTRLAHLEIARRSRSPKREASPTHEIPILLAPENEEWRRRADAVVQAHQIQSAAPPGSPPPLEHNLENLWERQQSFDYGQDKDEREQDKFGYGRDRSWEERFSNTESPPPTSRRGMTMAPRHRGYRNQHRMMWNKRRGRGHRHWSPPTPPKGRNDRWGDWRDRGRHCSPPSSPSKGRDDWRRRHFGGRGRFDDNDEWEDDKFIVGQGFGSRSSSFDLGSDSFGSFGGSFGPLAGPPPAPFSRVSPTSFEEDAKGWDWDGIEDVASLLFRFRANDNPASALPHTLDVVWANGVQERSVALSVSASGGGECSEKFVPLLRMAAWKATRLTSFRVRYENDAEWAFAYTKVARVAEVVSKFRGGREAKLVGVDGETFEYLVELGGELKEEEGKDGKAKGVGASFAKDLVNLSSVGEDDRQKQVLGYIG